VKLLVERHGDAMSYRAMMTPPAARRFLVKFPNTEVLGDLFALNRADIVGSGRPRHEHVQLVDEFESLVEHVMTESPPLTRHDLAVSEGTT
jgi:hypothetical protein